MTRIPAIQRLLKTLKLLTADRVRMIMVQTVKMAQSLLEWTNKLKKLKVGPELLMMETSRKKAPKPAWCANLTKC